MNSISQYNRKQLIELIEYLNTMPLSFRNRLGFNSNITFGNEIEVNGVDNIDMFHIIKDFNLYNGLTGEDRYMLTDDITVDSEIATPIMRNIENDWLLFFDMYNEIKSTSAKVGDNTSSHVHIGTKVINSYSDLSTLLKVLVVFEPIIYKFGYGTLDEPREYMKALLRLSNYSTISSPFRYKRFIDALDNNGYDLNVKFRKFVAKILNVIPGYKFENLDFINIGNKDSINEDEDHIEIRCFNGTIDPAIAQNNINLVCSIMDAVLNKRIDMEYVNNEYEKYKLLTYNFDRPYGLLNAYECNIYNSILDSYSNIDMDKALRLADMIFTSDKDKYYFIKQYLKLFSCCNEELKKKL